MNFCLVDHCVKTVENSSKVASNTIEIFEKYAKLIIKYHSYQTNGILSYIIFKFDQVTQNALNSSSNYEYLKNGGLDME